MFPSGNRHRRNDGDSVPPGSAPTLRPRPGPARRPSGAKRVHRARAPGGNSILVDRCCTRRRKDQIFVVRTAEGLAARRVRKTCDRPEVSSRGPHAIELPPVPMPPFGSVNGGIPRVVVPCPNPNRHRLPAPAPHKAAAHEMPCRPPPTSTMSSSSRPGRRGSRRAAASMRVRRVSSSFRLRPAVPETRRRIALRESPRRLPSADGLDMAARDRPVSSRGPRSSGARPPRRQWRTHAWASEAATATPVGGGGKPRFAVVGSARSLPSAISQVVP